jgi:hypothetical protein
MVDEPAPNVVGWHPFIYKRVLRCGALYFFEARVLWRPPRKESGGLKFCEVDYEYGGKIRVESELDKGADLVFTVRLKVSKHPIEKYDRKNEEDGYSRVATDETDGVLPGDG